MTKKIHTRDYHYDIYLCTRLNIILPYLLTIIYLNCEQYSDSPSAVIHEQLSVSAILFYIMLTGSCVLRLARYKCPDAGRSFVCLHGKMTKHFTLAEIYIFQKCSTKINVTVYKFEAIMQNYNRNFVE